jgi:type II secretory pathway pseudopilin PulG
MKKHTFSAKLTQLGISLLEVLLSLSIIAIILVLATRYFFVATNNNKINTAVSQIGGIVAAVHTWKGINTSYDGVSVQVLYDAGQLENFPGLDNNTASSVALKDLWGDEYSVTPAADDNHVTVTVTLPDTGNCEALKNAYDGATCNGTSFSYTFS